MTSSTRPATFVSYPYFPDASPPPYFSNTPPPSKCEYQLSKNPSEESFEKKDQPVWPTLPRPASYGLSSDPVRYQLHLNNELLSRSRRGHYGRVCILLEEKADPNTKDELGQTPMHLAAQKGHLVIMEALLKFGADKNALTTSSEETPLDYAIKGKQQAVVEMLRKLGAKANVLSSSTLSPISIIPPETQVPSITVSNEVKPIAREKLNFDNLFKNFGAVELPKSQKNTNETLLNAKTDDSEDFPKKIMLEIPRIEIIKNLMLMGANPRIIERALNAKINYYIQQGVIQHVWNDYSYALIKLKGNRNIKQKQAKRARQLLSK